MISPPLFCLMCLGVKEGGGSSAAAGGIGNASRRATWRWRGEVGIRWSRGKGPVPRVG